MNNKLLRIFNFIAVPIIAYSCIANGTEDLSATTIDAPQDLVLTYNDGTSMSFAWAAVEGAESYAARMELSSDALFRQVNTDVNEVTFDGLSKGVEYSVKVKAQKGKLVSDYSEPLVVVAGATEPDPVPEPEPDPEPGQEPEMTEVYSRMMIPAEEDQLRVALAFPGAEGGGMYTTGGRGGKVIHVTNLNDSGAGSLRDAVSQSGARTVVFDVAGTITLNSPLQIKNGDLTIAGQTAPGDGICIKGRYTQINCSNVIIRYVRFRLGDEDLNASDSDDAIWGRYCSDIILDHCSMSWCIDECASFYANERFTMQWCILAESMRSSFHSKGNHGYGGIWGGSNASFHHNLLAHHDSRNPRFDHPHIYQDHVTVPNRGVVDYRNNVVYDWGSNSSYGGEGYGAGKGNGINMVGNCYKPGPSSTDRKYFLDAYAVYASCSTCGSNIDEGYPLMYMNDNLHTAYPDITADNASGIYWHNGASHTNYGTVASRPFAVNGPSGQACCVTTHSSSDVLQTVCKWAGASLSRDAVDSRVTGNAVDGTGKIIDCVTATDGKTSVAAEYGFTWPELKADENQVRIASTDSDGDGIPDFYEDELGLDKNNSSDANAKTIDIYGRYTNLEMYLHYIVRETVSGQIQGGNYGKIR
ncbi:MAG: fibronectin type III domain-containing protein [Candidatus Cryptobacteroides sp.]